MTRIPGSSALPFAGAALIADNTLARTRDSACGRAEPQRDILAEGVQTSGRYPAALRLAGVPASILSVFTCAWAIAFTCMGLGDHHPRDKRGQHTRNGHGVARRFDHHLVRLQEGLAQALRRRAGHIDPASPPEFAVLPNHHLPEGPMDVHSDYSSHRPLLHRLKIGSVGRHDTYGSALTAQPGESQRRPPTNASSQLIKYIGLPALRGPGASVPDGRAIRQDRRISAELRC